MSTTPIQSKQGDLYIGVQADADTEATEFFKPRWLSGGLKVNKTVEEQEYLDGESFSTPFRFVKNVTGSGSLVMQGDALTIYQAVAWFFGNDAAGTEIVAPYSRTTVTAANAVGRHLTIIACNGLDPSAKRMKHIGCLVSSLKVEASADSGVVTVTMEVKPTKPGIHIAAAPAPETVTAHAVEPFVYTNSRSKLAGLAGGGRVAYIQQWALTLNREIEELFGDEVHPYGLHQKMGKVEVDASVAGNDDSIKAFFRHVYSTDTPADGAEPTAELYRAPFELVLSRGADATLEEVKFALPQVVWSAEDFEPQTDAGPVDIPLAGGAEKPTAGQMLTATAKLAAADIVF